MGDTRLNRREVLLAERLSQKPGASIPGACRSWSETVAAYRFLDNEEVNWDDVMAAHWQASHQRMAQHGVVLCIQDTTELDYNGQQTEGLGPLSYEAQCGMYLHSTYVVTSEREPLGVINAWMWAREFKDGDEPRSGLVESRRWIESYEIIAEQARKLHCHPADRQARGLSGRKGDREPGWVCGTSPSLSREHVTPMNSNRRGDLCITG